MQDKQFSFQVSLLSNRPLERKELLHIGQNKLELAIERTAWKQPSFLDPRSVQVDATRCFIYTPSPPVIKAKRHMRELPNWGTRPTKEELIEVDKLDHFCTDEHVDNLPVGPSTQRSSGSTKTRLINWFTLLPRVSSSSVYCARTDN